MAWPYHIVKMHYLPLYQYTAHWLVLYYLRDYYASFLCSSWFLFILCFSLKWRRHHYRWRALNFYLCLALIVIEQWKYNGPFEGPVLFTFSFCLFGVFRPAREFWRVVNFELCFGPTGIQQRGILSVLHLLWHVYNGLLRGHVTLTSIAEFLAVELSLPVFTI